MPKGEEKLLTKELVKSRSSRKASVRPASYKMPITKSAKKALRQSKTRRVGNLKRINGYKNTIKQFNKLVVASKSDALAMLDKVYQSIDKAAKAGVIKANKAARLKSHAILSVSKKK